MSSEASSHASSNGETQFCFGAWSKNGILRFTSFANAVEVAAGGVTGGFTTGLVGLVVVATGVVVVAGRNGTASGTEGLVASVYALRIAPRPNHKPPAITRIVRAP